MKIEVGKTFIFPFHFSENIRPFRMIWVDKGTFLMGSPKDEAYRIPEDEVQFQNTITKGFWLGEYLVTHAHWNAVMGLEVAINTEQSNYPQTNVSWYDAIIYSWELNRRFKEILVEGYCFNLPTETMWEYACRAGTQLAYYYTNSIEMIGEVAWYAENSSLSTQPVGKKLPNNWGFYDMLGNVSEWCLDTASEYPSSSATDWVATGDGLVRAIRGGSWGEAKDDFLIRCAGREWHPPLLQDDAIGFRIACIPSQIAIMY